ncbi:thiamine pyrophosphate-requiring protein [Evansella clarkii]|uniref:thiamine pyrophosphate-requiring protein n=1 Tax=Evansella clarkii TaxID=79879 RepID=UPI000996889D|nr:thiamine pyrophosphate-requiring protein [Evansella clarkii]
MTGHNKQQEVQPELVYTTSDAMMETLRDAGVEYFFVGLGSDHASLIESWAKAEEQGKDMPKIIVCPHEFLTLSIAHGYAQVTGRPQAVFVHVDVGTQNLGGSIHNVMRGRIPVFIFAGMSPATAENELPGSRNEFIHYLQDVPNQAGIVRDYMKYTHTVNSGKNMKQSILRSLQMAQSEPKGPVYMMTPREVLAEEIEDNDVQVDHFKPVEPQGITGSQADHVVNQLLKAKKPLIITSYLGRQEEAVPELVQLAESLSVPVVESGPYYMNFPSDHPFHLGYEDYTGSNESTDRVKEADYILVIDCDVPWIPLHTKPKEDCVVDWIDIDPTKENIPLWYYPTQKQFQANSYLSLKEINKQVSQLDLSTHKDAIALRAKGLKAKHEELLSRWNEKAEESSYITPDLLTKTLKSVLDEDDIVMNETISNFGAVWRNIRRNKVGTLYGAGASSLGWNGGAAIGAKLANPDKRVVALTGDGTYMFTVPSSVHWIASQYKTPFLTVIFNNRGWKSPKLSTLGVHPDGVASTNDKFWVNFGDNARMEKISEASGDAIGYAVSSPDELREVLEQAVYTVDNGRSAVVNVYLEPQTGQEL